MPGLQTLQSPRVFGARNVHLAVCMCRYVCRLLLTKKYMTVHDQPARGPSMLWAGTGRTPAPR